LNPNNPTADDEPDPDQRRPEPADGHDADADDQPGDRLQEEEGADGGDGAVAVRLAPEVEVDEGGPDQERAAQNEDGRGGQVERPAGAAGAEDHQGPEGAHTRHPETLPVLDVGADGGHKRDTGPDLSEIGLLWGESQVWGRPYIR
jgi:hypothetical protein